MSLLLLLVAPAMAADKTVDPFEEPDESELFRAEQRVVTVASRYAQTVRQAPSIVTVVTDDEIRARGCRTLSDVLRTIPGVYISVAKEGRDLAWFRGVISSDNNKFLVLVDGVPWYDGVYTHAWIDEYLPLVNVKQIEVIKGPGSAIYGTNAFAGVVNVVTYGGRDLQGGFARGEAGSRAHRGAAAVYADEVGSGGSDVEVKAHARYVDADGDGLDVTPRGRRDVNGLDPKRGVAAGFGLRVDALSLTLDAVDYRHTYFVNEQDDVIDVNDESADEFNLAYRNLFFSSRYDVELGSLGRLTPYAIAQVYDNPGSYAWINDLPVDDGTATWSTTLVETEKQTERYAGGIEAELRPAADHRTVTGAGVEVVHVTALVDRHFVDRSHTPESPSPFQADPGIVWDAFAFAQHTWTTSYWLEATAGARVDQQSYFGTFLSPRAGVLFIPGSRQVIKLLYGRAFRAPNVRELLVDVAQEGGINQSTASNPGLRPEVIDTVEGEITSDLVLGENTALGGGFGLKLRGAAFYSYINNEINQVQDTTPDPQLGDRYYVNRGGSTIIGGEAGAVTELEKWTIDVSYALTQAVDQDTGYLQYEFPPHMAHGRLGFVPVPGVTFSLLADAYGPRPRRDWTPDSRLQDGDPFALVHAAVATDLGSVGARGAAKNIRADVSVRNLLDTDYETLVYVEDANHVNADGTPYYPNDFEGEGRNVVVGVEYDF